MYILSSEIWKNFKKIIGRRKGYGLKRSQNRYSGMRFMDAKTTTIRKLYVQVVLNVVIFRQILYEIVPYARDFLPVKFSTKYYFNKLCLQLPQNVTWTDE